MNENTVQNSSASEQIINKSDTTPSDIKLKQSQENTLLAAGCLFVVMAIIISLWNWNFAIGIGAAFVITLIYIIMVSCVFEGKCHVKFTASSLNTNFDDQIHRTSDYESKISDDFTRIQIYDPSSNRDYGSINPATGLPMINGLSGMDYAGNSYGTKIS